MYKCMRPHTPTPPSSPAVELDYFDCRDFVVVKISMDGLYKTHTHIVVYS